MQDSDLIVGVLAAQAGFATPSQVLTAAAAGLVDSESDSLLTRLERTGALSQERRKVLEALAEQAFQARNGDARALATSLGGAPAFLQTLLSATGTAVVGEGTPRSIGSEVPLERPGQYTRRHELGRGSQSVVVAARDEIVGRDVALKELAARSETAPDAPSTRAARVRFLREVRLVAGLDHPGIVAIHELAHRDDGTLFCAQKLIRGETLQARLGRCHSLGDRLRLVRHVLDACQAIGFAHSKCVIHRDLKPSNVMVGEYGETVVVDWGLAKHREEAEEVVPLLASAAEPGLTIAGVALGTPAYMSPEQARGDIAAIDARSDVFSLGAILYQVLTGRPPFEGATSDHIMENVRAGNFASVRVLVPGAPPELAAIAERALRPAPSERYPDAEALAKEVAAYLAGGRVRAYQYGTWELVRKFAASHRALTAGIAVAAGALLISAVVFAVRLEVARRDLARSYMERARTAESDSDWALAAAYFGAARTKHDTAEARWGVALAGERAIERVLSLRGPADSYTDVGVLPDGRVVTLAASANEVTVRELESGRVLWTHEEKLIAAAALLPGGQVRLSLPGGWAFFAAATGKHLGMFDRNTDGRPCPGPYPTPVTLLGGKLLARVENGAPRVLATNVGGGVAFCIVSDDGRLVAYQDTSERVRLLSVADGRSLGEKSASGLQNFLFSSHGLVLVRKGWLDVLGAPEGDFSVRLADPPIQGRASNPLGGVRASPDGHLLIVTRSGASRSDLVDLRTRAVRGTIRHSPGWPRFAFSSDGKRVFAAGLRGASELAAWRLPHDEYPAGHPGHWHAIRPGYSPSGRRIVLADVGRAVEVFGEHGELLDSEPLSSMPTGVNFAGEDMIVIADFNADGITLRDVVRHRTVWKRHCRSCSWDGGISGDGSRIVTAGLDGVEVWDARVNRVLFAETVRLSGFETRTALSPDGRRVVWTAGARAYLRDLESAEEKTFLLDGKPIQVTFSPDSSRLAVVTPERLSLWNVRSAQALWAVSHPTTGDSNVEVGWTPDRRSILVRYPGLGTELIDTETGERLALFPAPGSVLPMFTMVSSDLRARLSVSETGWELRPLPQPASDSPAEGLEKTLRKTGLALQGVEVVAAP